MFYVLAVFGLLFTSSDLAGFCYAASPRYFISAGNAAMHIDWKEEVVHAAINKYVPLLTRSMTPQDVQRATQTYMILFRRDLDALGNIRRDLAEPIFDAQVDERMSRTNSLGLQERKQELQESYFLARVVAPSDIVQKTAESIVRGETITPQVKSSVEQACGDLKNLAETLLEQSPGVQDQAGPQVSEALLDCMFISEGGEPTSLRVSKYKEYWGLRNRK